jgi:hypothetical protein
MLLKDMLPQGNAVPGVVYKAKQRIYPLGLDVEKIHTCKNDCILYCGLGYEDHEKCPIYKLDPFNHIKDGGDDENYNKIEEKVGLERCFGTFL